MASLQEAANTAYTYTLLHSRNKDINDNVNIYQEEFGKIPKYRQVSSSVDMGILSLIMSTSLKYFTIFLGYSRVCGNK